MEANSYTNLAIVSAKKPVNTHLFQEMSDGDLFLVDSGDDTEIYKSTDKGDNWSQPDGDFSRANTVLAMYYDRSTEILYFTEDDDLFKITLSTNVVAEIALTFGGGDTWDDIVKLDSKITTWGFFNDGGDLKRIGSTTSAGGIYATLGAIGALTWDFSFGVAVGPLYYYLFQWSNGNPLLYKQQLPDAGFTHTLAEDCGANLAIPSGFNQKGIAYDGSNNIKFILQDTGDSKYYLYNYAISTDTLTRGGEYNVGLMRDQDTASGITEKAFHITTNPIYQLHSVLPYQLHLIAKPSTDDIWIAITDNFLMNDDGDMYEFEDISSYIIEATINMRKMGAWTGSISIADTYPIEGGEIFIVKDMFTTATSSSVETIFEGYVNTFTKRFIQDLELVSPAQRDLDEEFPSGDYAGRTDEIIVLLIAAHGDYITSGAMSAGMAMGTITFGGDKSLREILDEFALQDHFIWYLTPTGVLLYNNGTVDSGENFTAASPISNVDKTFGERAVNYVNIKGGFVDRVQVTGTVAENIPDQQTNGRLPFEQTFSHLDLAAQCTTTNTNVLARLGTQPLIIPFTHKDATVGVIQVGETVTFEYNLTDPNIDSDQDLILDCIYDAKQGKANYRISDIVI